MAITPKGSGATTSHMDEKGLPPICAMDTFPLVTCAWSTVPSQELPLPVKVSRRNCMEHSHFPEDDLIPKGKGIRTCRPCRHTSVLLCAPPMDHDPYGCRQEESSPAAGRHRGHGHGFTMDPEWRVKASPRLWIIAHYVDLRRMLLKCIACSLSLTPGALVSINVNCRQGRERKRKGVERRGVGSDSKIIECLFT